MPRVSESDVKNSWKVGRLEERPGSADSDALFGLVEAVETAPPARGGDEDPGAPVAG